MVTEDVLTVQNKKMKKVDYSKIAEQYDNDRNRKAVPIDSDLGAYLETLNDRQCKVLDLACGTGNYLKAQNYFYSQADIRWFGLDSSEDMLGIAKSKIKDVEYTLHNAEEGLPYQSRYFDYVVNNFAFHQFVKKEYILDEIKRTLKPDGIFRMRTGAMDKRLNWWLYRYFPVAKIIDQKRFWSGELLFFELETRGFSVQINIEHTYSREPLAEIFKSAINKDASQFALMDDHHYESGLENMKWELDKDPNKAIINEFALMVCVACKKN